MFSFLIGSSYGPLALLPRPQDFAGEPGDDGHDAQAQERGQIAQTQWAGDQHRRALGPGAGRIGGVVPRLLGELRDALRECGTGRGRSPCQPQQRLGVAVQLPSGIRPCRRPGPRPAPADRPPGPAFAPAPAEPTALQPPPLSTRPSPKRRHAASTSKLDAAANASCRVSTDRRRGPFGARVAPPETRPASARRAKHRPHSAGARGSNEAISTARLQSHVSARPVMRSHHSRPQQANADPNDQQPAAAPPDSRKPQRFRPDQLPEPDPEHR